MRLKILQDLYVETPDLLDNVPQTKNVATLSCPGSEPSEQEVHET